MSSDESIRWGYEGKEGPAHWGDLSDRYRCCKIGKNQSPVDIAATVDAERDAIEFGYGETSLTAIHRGYNIEVIPREKVFIDLGAKRYTLLQFHFHMPSEHTRRGTRYAMEAHLVHEAQDGELAVVAVFMKKGASNSLFEALRRCGRLKPGQEQTLAGAPRIAELLPPEGSYYYVTGSLTTPPCSEGVLWYIMKEPIEVSQEEIDFFVALIGENARPLQPLNGRVPLSVKSGETTMIKAERRA